MRSARSGSSLMAKMPAVGAGHEAVVQGELVGQVAALGDLDRVDLADEVGDRGVGRGQLLAEALVAVHPGDRRVVAELGDEGAGVRRHRGVGVVVDLGPGDDRQPLVEQGDERPDHAGLRLAALAQEDHVVAGQEGVLELGQDGVVVAEHAGEQGLAGADLGDGVAAQLLLDGHGLPAGCPELAAASVEGCRTGHPANLPWPRAQGIGPHPVPRRSPRRRCRRRRHARRRRHRRPRRRRGPTTRPPPRSSPLETAARRRPGVRDAAPPPPSPSSGPSSTEIAIPRGHHPGRWPRRRGHVRGRHWSTARTRRSSGTPADRSSFGADDAAAPRPRAR